MIVNLKQKCVAKDQDEKMKITKEKIKTKLKQYLYTIIILFLVANMATLVLGKTNLFHQYIVHKNTKASILDMLDKREGWELLEVGFVTIQKVGNYYDVYIKVINEDIGTWTNDFIIVDINGTIINQQLTSKMDREVSFSNR